MKLLEKLETYKNSGKIALKSGEDELSYKELWEYSDSLADYLLKNLNKKEPLVVYGHKNPFMIVCFLACVKSGHTYCPVDTSISPERLNDIVNTVKPEIILSCTNKNIDGFNTLTINDIIRLSKEIKTNFDKNNYVKEQDIFYIIFTSGSTGTPKGVEISYQSLNNFIKWISTLDTERNEQKLYLNQAPFSFDLSVMDLYLSLYNEGKLILIEKEIQSDYSKLFDRLKNNLINTWVSTPSFVDICLASEEFNDKLLPSLDTFLFCGEILTKKTAEMLLHNFPKAKVYNTYGPTESTVAVTSVEITQDIINKYNSLPVGKPKKGTEILIDKEEMVIVGDTVSNGYFSNPILTDEKFSIINSQRAYRTGDKGFFLDELLFYSGRIDNQIKLNGYRIELEDIENNMMRVNGVSKVAVLPKYEEGKVKYLIAYCMYTKEILGKLKAIADIKEELKQYIPSYMIPKKIIFIEKIPTNNNGKIDRKKLMELGDN
ncbi:D-alanine--poly(phosphoribitol) ligase subunit DltA [Fusobacterium polymorphum]|uniref:D-alanine--poly(phosphoribitol) ligase subunit DltA n=1 Tax=Fusobacterium nucleatum subsp. polymorphum TaxID=76857 RepID=UPI00300B9EC8